jgi:hypothetical protein
MDDGEDIGQAQPEPAEPGPAPAPPPQAEPAAPPPSPATRTAAVVRALSLLAAAAHYAHRVVEAAALSEAEWADDELSRVMSELREAGERIEEILP